MYFDYKRKNNWYFNHENDIEITTVILKHIVAFLFHFLDLLLLSEIKYIYKHVFIHKTFHYLQQYGFWPSNSINKQ